MGWGLGCGGCLGRGAEGRSGRAPRLFSPPCIEVSGPCPDGGRDGPFPSRPPPPPGSRGLPREHRKGRGLGDLVGWGSGCLLWDMLMSVPWTLSSTRPGELWSSQRNKPLTSSDLCNLPSFQGETFRTCCVGSLWQDFWGLPEALCTWIFYKRSVFSV